MCDIQESYRKIGEATQDFDIKFWQSQGDQAIFDAALEMIKDYLILRGENAHESRLQRTIESFQRI